jgi:hypothetical protein
MLSLNDIFIFLQKNIRSMTIHIKIYSIVIHYAKGTYANKQLKIYNTNINLKAVTHIAIQHEVFAHGVWY